MSIVLKTSYMMLSAADSEDFVGKSLQARL